METIYRHEYDSLLNTISVKEFKAQDIDGEYINKDIRFVDTDWSGFNMEKRQLDYLKTFSTLYIMYSLKKDVEFFKEKVREDLKDTINFWKRSISRTEEIIKEVEEKSKKLDSVKVEG